MEQNSEPTLMTLSVLVTREEYSEAAAHHRRQKPGRAAPLITGVGVLLVVLGFAGLFFGRQISLSASAAFCLILLGVFLACYDAFFAPLLERASAAREYDEKEDLHFATIYEFGDDTLSIENGRIQGEIPLALLTRWSETPALFTMAVGRELSMAIPKRLMTSEQGDTLRRLLETKAGGAKR